MKYREIKEKLDAKGFQYSGCQTDCELPMVHFDHPKIKSDNWGITIQFDRDINVNDFVEEDEEYSVTEGFILDVDVSSVEFGYNVSISFMSEGIIPTGNEDEQNIIVLYNEDLKLFDKVLEIVCDPYAALNFATEYAENVNKFMSWVNKFIPSFEKLKLSHYPYRANGDSNALYSSIGIKFESNSLKGIWFEMSVLNWNMTGHIKLAPGYCEHDSAYFNETTSVVDFRAEVGRQWQEHLWYEEKMKNVKSIGGNGDVTLLNGKKVRYEDL